MFLLLRCSYIASLNTKQVVFDYILPLYFVILYNTTGMSHMKCLVYVVSFPGSIICTQLK